MDAATPAGHNGQQKHRGARRQNVSCDNDHWDETPMIPPNVFDPPFRITRTSHFVLTVRDIEASLTFYTEVLGLVVSAREANTLYLRGIEEACHHSLVLKRADGEPVCQRVGLRAITEDDLDRAFHWLTGEGRAPRFVEAPGQGRTLWFDDAVGTPIELTARMDAMPRMITKFSTHRGGCAQRIDHCQILTPKVRRARDFWMSLGFRLSEYIAPDGVDEVFGVFLQRKGNPHDLVFFNGEGPRLHHFAYAAAETHNLLRACDVAGELGYGKDVERGPGRHGPGHALFVYFRDPDGHRVELFNTHYQCMDLENEPVRWDPGDPKISLPWGLPAQRKWFEEATRFDHVQTDPPKRPPMPLTLEKFLAR